MKKSTFLLLCIEGAVLSFNVAACVALIPQIASTFQVEQFIAGRLTWIYMLPYGVAALVYGPLIRIVDAKKVECICILFFACSNFFAATSQTIEALFISRFFMGLSGASVIPLGLILIAQEVKSRERGKYVGFFFSATFIASLIGLVLSGFVPWRNLFLIPAVSGFLLFFGMVSWLPNFGVLPGQKVFRYWQSFQHKGVRLVFFYIFFISMFYHGVQQWLGVYFSQGYLFNQMTISLLVTLTSFSGIFGEAIGGYLSDLIGRIPTINLGILCMIAGLVLLLVRLPLFLLILPMLLWGFGWTLNHAGVSTVLTDLPGNLVHEAASLNSGIRFLSGGIGTVIGGIILQKSFSLGFLLFGVCLLFLYMAHDHFLRIQKA